MSGPSGCIDAKKSWERIVRMLRKREKAWRHTDGKLARVSCVTCYRSPSFFFFSFFAYFFYFTLSSFSLFFIVFFSPLFFTPVFFFPLRFIDFFIFIYLSSPFPLVRRSRSSFILETKQIVAGALPRLPSGAVRWKTFLGQVFVDI